METITLKDNPKLASIVRLVSRKHKAFLSKQDHVVLSGTAWDGGSRSSYFKIHIESLAVEAMPHYAPVQFGGEVTKPMAIDPGYAIVEAGIFCGKPATPSVYIRKDQVL
jgi:hypothetical protein